MDAITETTNPLLPDPNPTPDALFDDSEAVDDRCDLDALSQVLLPEDVRFFSLPLMERLHRRQYHLLKLRGTFDLEKLAQDHQSQLLRSESNLTPNDRTHIERLLLDLGGGVFVVNDPPHLMVYAPTTQVAVEAAAPLKKYRRLERENAGFKLVSLSCGSPTAQLIPVEQAAPVNEQELTLHYGDDFVAWERPWLERLRQRRSGVTVLHGPPGCGKTSYLRGLMSRLIDRFEFYYLPVSTFHVLTSPHFVSFWLEQAGERRGKQRIAVMEDSEQLLLPRDAGSQTDVSNLLNIGDGFLGERLRLHMIATTNSPIRQLDPALLRPGRLMGTREFRRLTRPEAQRLAEAKGLALADQPDFSLAELYCGAVASPALNADRQIGFAQ